MTGDNLQLLCSAAAASAAGGASEAPPRHRLIIRQQPERSRVGSVSEKMDRRPIDPPPIIQLIVHDPSDPTSLQYTVSPAFFMQVQLLDESGETVIHQIKGHKATAMAGSMVSPLHPLRDMSSVHGAYFVFSDLSVRMEGAFRLRFDLFEIAGANVYNRATATSGVFFVYSPKRFPGMMESTQLSRVFAEQGLRIRIRTEAGTKKRGKKAIKAKPSKRARLSDSDDAPLNMMQFPSIAETPMFQYPGAPGFSNTLPASSLAQGLPLPPPRSFGNSGMLAFPNDPFAACQENKENIPMANQQTRHVGHMLQPDMSRQLLEKTPPGTALDLDDIAAVALLDSLSNGTSRPLAASSSTLSQLLASSSAQPNYSGILYSTTPTLAPIKPVQRFSSLPKKQPDSLGLIPGAGLNSGMPFSNYRLSAVRSPEFTGNPQAPMTTSESMLFGESSRFHPTLRSSSFGLQLNMGAGQAVSDPPVLRMPQHQLYHGPAGDHSSSPYVAGTYEVSPITARLQQTNHASVAQPGYAGTFA